MKSSLKLFLATVTFAMVPAFLAAAERTAHASPDSKPAQKCEPCKDACKCEAGKCKCPGKKDGKKEKLVVLTGSRIPQKVTKVGAITDGMHPVIVLTREDLESTGTNDLGNALRRLVPSMH